MIICKLKESGDIYFPQASSAFKELGRGTSTFFFLVLKNKFRIIAARLPVITPSLTRMLKKDGRDAKRLGTAVTPSPSEIEHAIISKLLFVNSTLLNIRIPEEITIPNMITVAPPRTAFGIIVANAAIFGIEPRKIKIPPAATTTLRVLIPDSSTSPTF